MRAALGRLRPDALLAAADRIDGTLNNQSLVVLFTCRGKKLLFVGDAQWGSWAYWLYGREVRGVGTGPQPPGGRHPVVDRLLQGRAPRQHERHPDPGGGGPQPAGRRHGLHRHRRLRHGVGRHRGAPHTLLLDALRTRTRNRTVRSDWVGGPGMEPDPEARATMAALPRGFSTANDLAIDVVL